MMAFVTAVMLVMNGMKIKAEKKLEVCKIDAFILKTWTGQWDWEMISNGFYII